MYGYGRVYRSIMGSKAHFTSKYCRKFNIENKNIEKYAFFIKTIFLQKKVFPPPSSFPKYPKKLKWLVLGYSTLTPKCHPSHIVAYESQWTSLANRGSRFFIH
jgi:hypothetical protein